jgi:two-component system, OmpR family, response regulator
MQGVTGLDTILIVDDSSFIVEGLIALLKTKFRPLAAYGGAECLDILKRETPSVIILDIMMEPMDGWETLSRIKENPETRHIPVLMFSAKKISPEEAEEHRIRIDDFITKPVSPKKIIEAIEKVLARRDTNRYVVERWQSAGISREKIDEYLSLVTSLEVDLSLCQNMQIQNDIAHPGDKAREEFQEVITAIEDRIRQERELIETLVQGMNAVMAHSSGVQDSAGAGCLLPEDRSASPVPAAVTGSDFLPSLLPEENAPEMPVSGLAAAVPDNPGTADPDHAGATTVINPPASPLVPDLPEQDTPGTDQGPEVQVTDPIPADIPVSPVLPHAENTPRGITPLPDFPPGTGMIEPETPAPDRDPGQDDSAGGSKPGPASLPGSPALFPLISADILPVIEERKAIPADLDLPPASSGTSSPAGAGTDVPMPWEEPKDRKHPARVAGQDEKKTIKKTGTAAPSPGIFARVISLVRSLFGKRV